MKKANIILEKIFFFLTASKILGTILSMGNKNLSGENEMSEFKKFKTAVQKQFELMKELDLFVVDVDKDELWNFYLSSFPPGTNPVFRERTEHDCQCCKQFIKRIGGLVSIKNNNLVSIWDITVDNQTFQVVADKLASYIKNHKVCNAFLSPEKKIGTDKNIQLLESGTLTWEHFCLELPNRFVVRGESLGTKLSNFSSGKDVFERALKEITIDAVETVLELIEQNSLYRGEENKNTVETFLKLKKEYDEINGSVKRGNYCWVQSVKSEVIARVRNSAIGTLLVDISEGMELDKAVRSFESKVAPENYKRPTALITKSMIESAQKKVEELGIKESLSRRYATKDDITVNNLLFVDRGLKSKASQDIFDELKSDAVVSLKKLSKVEEIVIEKFITDIVPKAEKIEILFENRMANNLVSLIAPSNQESPNIFKWNNNFSWSYNGEVADSIKERVKQAGGEINGVLRCSLSWYNYDDLDIHIEEPDGNHIYYRNRQKKHPSSGMLDVDMNAGSGKTRNAVENIVWTNKKRMQEGVYHLYINNFQLRERIDIGFDVEMEYEGQIWKFKYNKIVKNKENVTVAKFSFSHKDGIKIISSLPSEETSKKIWGISTQTFNLVSGIMYSPNYWNGHATGNKHYFFMIDKCVNDKPARGFYNEFMREEFKDHRKVFEVLGSKMKTECSDNQLCGLGFSSTQRNNILCRVSGSFNRVLKVIF